MTQTEVKTLEWSPLTHSTVPQPAGSLCADWYSENYPDAETILYALAHTKSEADQLREALEQMIPKLMALLNATPYGELPIDRNAAWVTIEKARAVLSRVQA